MDKATQWLLEEENPAARYRALTELVGLPEDSAPAAQARAQTLGWLPQARDGAWMSETKGLWLRYNLLALAECGLTARDVDIGPALAQLAAQEFDAACGDGLVLRALVMMGCTGHPEVRAWLDSYAEKILPDGGFLCLHRLDKMKVTPKSCIKDNMHTLLLLAECRRYGIEFGFAGRLVSYFLDRGVFYKSGRPGELVLDCRPGWRMTDNFFPAEVMRVGLPQLLYAFAALGAGRAPELDQAWVMLEEKKDREGRYLLEGTLQRSYLPKGKVGQPGKWVTLYALLAWKYRDAGAAGHTGTPST